MVFHAPPPLFYKGDLTWIPLTLFRFLKQQAQENLQNHIHEVVAHAGMTEYWPNQTAVKKADKSDLRGTETDQHVMW